ncbi:hypothetical protein IE077_003163, partial [Cardiosporidium cionae]
SEKWDTLSLLNRDNLNKSIHILVASDVMAEGIDVQTCNCCISMKTPTNYREFVQTRGRLRQSSSSYYVLRERPHFPLLQPIKFSMEFLRYDDIFLDYCNARAASNQENLALESSEKNSENLSPSDEKHIALVIKI